MSPRETGPQNQASKQRTGRIGLDYYKKADRLSLGKGWLSALAAVAVLLWVSGLGFGTRPWTGRSERTSALLNPGTLSRAHATWDSECEACHVPFRPIDGSAWSARFVGDPRAGDNRCRSCHTETRDHHPAVTPATAAASCASCHREHRGRETSLVASSDRNCTRCHAGLSAVTGPGHALGAIGSVTRFDADRSHHPEFALFRTGTPRDPGTLRFTHARHMTRGLPEGPGGRPLKTLADLAAEDRPRYRTGSDPDDTQGVQLRCDSCHHSDGPRIQPVRYDADCRACHPLSLDPAMPPARHPQTLAEIDDALWQSYSARYVRDHPELKENRPSPRSIPGRENRPENREARRGIADQVARAERLLFGEKRCGECHRYETADRREVPAPMVWEPSKPVKVAAPNVPQVWLTHAVFDHSAHRVVGCRSCHARAYPDDRNPSQSSADVILPTIAVCQTCHAPREKTASSVTGGAGFACVECHRYHSGDDGRASPPLDSASETALQDFLMGTVRPKRGAINPPGAGPPS